MLYFVYLLFPPEDLFEIFLCDLLIFDLTISYIIFCFSCPPHYITWKHGIFFLFHLKISFFLFFEKNSYFFYFIAWKFPTFSEISHPTPALISYRAFVIPPTKPNSCYQVIPSQWVWGRLQDQMVSTWYQIYPRLPINTL